MLYLPALMLSRYMEENETYVEMTPQVYQLRPLIIMLMRVSLPIARKLKEMHCSTVMGNTMKMCQFMSIFKYYNRYEPDNYTHQATQTAKTSL